MQGGAFEKRIAEEQSRRARRRRRLFGFTALAVALAGLLFALGYAVQQWNESREALRELQSAVDSQPAEVTQPPSQQTEEAVAEEAASEEPAVVEEVVPELAEEEATPQPAEEEAASQAAEDAAADSDATEEPAEAETAAPPAEEEVSPAQPQPTADAESDSDAADAETARKADELRRQAETALANDDAAAAAAAVQQALALAPDDAGLLDLQSRIAVLAEVLDWLQQAQTARAENRVQKEIEALQKVQALDATRPEVARLQTLRAAQAAAAKEAAFRDALTRGEAAIGDGNWGAAEAEIARANDALPGRPETAALQQQLQQARDEAEFAAALQQAAQAQARDDWSAALQHFAAARKLKPNDASATEKETLAKQIVDAQAKLQALTDSAPQMGGVDGARAAAAVHSYLNEVAALTEHSGKLRAAHAELTRLKDAYETEAEVVVLSDNETDIIVRGVGQVGKVERKTIRLRPGKYWFEGSRAGYRSKLVEVEVAPGGGAEVEVVCDEKI